MIRSGIVPIDELCTGFRPRSTYLLTGGAGAGKTLCSLQFLNEGLQRGEPVVMLTHASRDDLLACGTRLGLDLRAALLEVRAVVVRYRPDFARRIARAGTTERVFDELRALITKYRPRRIVLDTFAPLLDDGSPSPIAAASLAELLERSQATSLLTYSDDLGDRYDRRLEPVVQGAEGVFRLTRSGGTRRVEVVSLRRDLSPSSVATALHEISAAGARDALITASGPLLLLHVSDSPTDDLLATLRMQHDVVARAAGKRDDVDAGAAALIVEADHTTLDRARELVRASAGVGVPIVVISRFNLRSLDRARLLRDGADEVLAGDMGAAELLQRLATTLRRGHLRQPPAAVHEDESLTQRALASDGALLDRDRFDAALRARSAHDDAVPFTIVRLTTQEAAADYAALGSLVLATMRASSGDLAALLDEGIAVYLHGAGRRDVAAFVDRLRARRPAAAPPLRAASASFPSDGAAVRQLVEPLEVR